MGNYRAVSQRLIAFGASLAFAAATFAPALAAGSDDRSLAKAADSLIELFTGTPASAPAPNDHRPPSHTQKHGSTRAASAKHFAPAVAHVESKPAAHSEPPSNAQANSGSGSSSGTTAPEHVTVAAPPPVTHPAAHVEARHVAQAPGKPHKHTAKSSAADDWLKESGPPAGDDAGSGAH